MSVCVCVCVGGGGGGPNYVSWYNLSSSSLQWIYSGSCLKRILGSNIFNFVSKVEDSILLEQAAFAEV